MSSSAVIAEGDFFWGETGKQENRKTGEQENRRTGEQENREARDCGKGRCRPIERYPS